MENFQNNYNEKLNQNSSVKPQINTSPKRVATRPNHFPFSQESKQLPQISQSQTLSTNPLLTPQVHGDLSEQKQQQIKTVTDGGSPFVLINQHRILRCKLPRLI